MYNSCVLIQDVALKTCRERWTIEKVDGRGSGRSVLVPRYDDDFISMPENSERVVTRMILSRTLVLKNVFIIIIVRFFFVSLYIFCLPIKIESLLFFHLFNLSHFNFSIFFYSHSITFFVFLHFSFSDPSFFISHLHSHIFH